MELINNIGGRGEKILKKSLQDDERVLVKLQGSFGEALVLTDKRLYIVKWGFMAGNTFGGRCNAFEFRSITSVEFKKSLLTGSVEILTPATQNTQKSFWSSNNSTPKADNIVSMQRDKFDIFAEAVKIIRNKISESHTGGITSSINPGADYTDLEKLAELKEKGIITEEEFQAKKKQILGI
ncbi:MAG: SHOCT domain-containing protein [Candidatus Moranbacteria bacterium]|nr:SHOCT domain-containing protein [Candidatus Moranbacteria bacterium]